MSVTMTVPVARGYYWCRRGLLFSCLMMAAVSPLTIAQKKFQLVLLHTNDMFSRFNQIDQFGGKCSNESDDEKPCYGGFARVKTVVDSERAAANDGKSAAAVDAEHAVTTDQDVGVLYLDAGNSFRGKALYLYNKEGISEVMEKLNPDVMCLGSHDFDEGLENIKQFIHNSDTPIVCSNIDVSNEPLLSTEKNLMKSKIVIIKGRQIGIIGYLTPATQNVATKSMGYVKIKPEKEEIQNEVNYLKSKGVNIIIALGHSGFEMDKLIAQQVKGIDIVIGGNSRAFVYKEEAPDIKKPYNSYPFLVISEDSTKKTIPVVHANHNPKYLGKVVVDFDENDKIIEACGNPILLDHEIQQDLELLEVIKQIENRATTEKIQMIIGSTSVFLQGDAEHCGKSECNFGNFITDALINYNIRMNMREFNLSEQWTDASVAIIHNGAIGSNISQTHRKGDIIMDDVSSALPFRNDIGKITIKGIDLRNIIEYGAMQYTDVERKGSFIQVSGLKISLDFSENTSFPARKFLVRCAKCIVPVYENLIYNKDYTIIVTKYLVDGGNGFKFTNSHTEYTDLGMNEAEIIMEEMSIHSPIVSEISGRIVILDDCSDDEQPKGELSFSRETEDSGVVDSCIETAIDIFRL